MPNAIFNVPAPVNEPVRDYAPGDPIRASLKQRLDKMLQEEIEMPLIIGGEEVRTGHLGEAVCPHDHGHVLGRFHQAGEAEIARAVEASQEAWKTWSEMAWEDRAAIFLKAADLLAGPWRDTINAATMLNQSKTVFQAEIDAACELIDFWRYNAHYMRQMYTEQPNSPAATWNRVEYRALEGFIFAVTPFNFTSIGGNLPTAPALMGNVVLWKPASSAVLSAYYIMRLLEEAGLPPGVINLVPGTRRRGRRPGARQPAFGRYSLHRLDGDFPIDVADDWREYRALQILSANRRRNRRQGFHLRPRLRRQVDSLADGDHPCCADTFEYQGQKCSAASPLPTFRDNALAHRVVRNCSKQIKGTIKHGSPM